VEADHAWAAGFFDGEGSLDLKQASKASTNSRVRFQPRLVVGQTKREPLDKLRSLYGGNIRLRRSQRPGQKACWAWELTGMKGFRELAHICYRF
jgi:hypothetical protein